MMGRCAKLPQSSRPDSSGKRESNLLASLESRHGGNGSGWQTTGRKRLHPNSSVWSANIETEQTFLPDSYSYRKASTGSIREALKAGKNPETTPTRERMTNETSITVVEACRKMSPSWLAVLYNSL